MPKPILIKDDLRFRIHIAGTFLYPDSYSMGFVGTRQKVLSPTIYWVLSIVASYLFVIYGWFRNDFAILLGQLISYYIYIWNLNETGVWKRINRFVKSVLIVTPIIAIMFVIQNGHYFIEELV